MTRTGILALQGDVREHVEILRGLGATTALVRTPTDLENVDALVLPGGESTTIGFLLDEHGMIEPLRKRIDEGLPVLGTCAGAILLAREVVGGGGSGGSPGGTGGLPPTDGQSGATARHDWPKIGSLDIVIHRNAYGRQVDSFEGEIDVAGVGTIQAVFIRAPVIEAVGAGVEVLASHAERPVVVRQGNVLAATFHPELAHEAGLHRLLLEGVRGGKDA